MKPRIWKLQGGPLWAVDGLGRTILGNSPSDAYKAFLKAIMTPSAYLHYLQSINVELHHND